MLAALYTPLGQSDAGKGELFGYRLGDIYEGDETGEWSHSASRIYVDNASKHDDIDNVWVMVTPSTRTIIAIEGEAVLPFEDRESRAVPFFDAVVIYDKYRQLLTDIYPNWEAKDKEPWCKSDESTSMILTKGDYTLELTLCRLHRRFTVSIALVSDEEALKAVYVEEATKERERLRKERLEEARKEGKTTGLE